MSARFTPKRRSSRQPIRMACEGIERRLLMCGSHFSEAEFLAEFPTEAAMLKGELPPAYEEPAGPEGGPDAVNIVWINRGLASDNFTTVFGGNAGTARSVVDAVIRHYERVITNVNQSSGNNRIDVTISMDPNDLGFGGGAGSYVVGGDGRMTAGAITIDSGNDTNGNGTGDGAGWYLDPVPDDFAEFNGQITNAFAVDAPAGSPANGLSDLYTIVMAEMTHVLGINSNTSTLYNLAGTREWTDTNQSDTAEGGGVGTFHVFQGDLISHLMTSNNGGSGGTDRGVPLHGAGPGVNVNFNAQTWIGAQDAMNASYEGSRRYLVPETSRLIMADAFGYTTTNAQQFGTGYANLNRSTGVLTVRGGDFHPGSPVTNDRIYITTQGSTIYVAVDPPADIAGTWTLPGGGDFPSWTSTFTTSEVSSIVINSEDGDDDIFVYGVPSGITVSVNAGNGNDFIQVGDGDVDDINTGVQGNVAITGGAGADSVSFFDFFDDIGNDDITVTSSTIQKTASSTSGVVSYGTVEEITVTGNPQNDTFLLNSALSTVDYIFNGFGGNDTLVVGAGDFDTIDGNVTLSGGAGTDLVRINDSTDTGSDTYQVSGNRFEKTVGGTGSVVASSSTEQMVVLGNTGGSTWSVPQLSSFLDVTLTGGAGNDSFSGFFGNNFDNNLQSSLTFQGGGGTDSITINDQGSAGLDYNLDNNSLDKGGAGVFNYTTSESFVLNCNAGDNDITLLSTFSSCPVTINGNSGNDQVFVNDGSSFLFNFGSDITFNGGGGTSDQVNINDSGFAGAETYTVTNGRVVLPFNSADVFHTGAESVVITGGNGGNTINVDQTNIDVFALGGDGADTFNIGNGDFDTNITAGVLVVGGNGADIAIIDDTLDAGSNTWTTTAGQTAKDSGTGTVVTSFFGVTIDHLRIDAGGGNSVFNVNAIGSSTTTMDLTINAGLGNDTVNAGNGNLTGNLYGTVSVAGQGGTDSLFVNDLSDAGADTYNMSSGSVTKLDWAHAANHNSVENFTLQANTADNTINVTSASSLTTYRLNGNAGADTFDVVGTSSAGVIVHGGAGLDNVRVNDDEVGTAVVNFEQAQDLNSLQMFVGSTLNVLPGGDNYIDAVTTGTLRGILNLNDNFLITGSSVPFILDKITRGYNAGGWDGLPAGASSGVVRSTTAAGSALADGLGYVQIGAAAGQLNIAVYRGVGVAAGEMIVSYTLYGDNNLDRTVGIGDFANLAANFNLAGTNWLRGDYNFDGTTGIADFANLAANYNQSIPSAPARSAATPSHFASTPIAPERVWEDLPFDPI